MVGGLGPLELSILLLLFFVLFGAQRLPELANALGRSKGEFQKGLSEVSAIGDSARTIADLEAGGRLQPHPGGGNIHDEDAGPAATRSRVETQLERATLRTSSIDERGSRLVETGDSGQHGRPPPRTSPRMIEIR